MDFSISPVKSDGENLSPSKRENDSSDFSNVLSTPESERGDTGEEKVSVLSSPDTPSKAPSTSNALPSTSSPSGGVKRKLDTEPSKADHVEEQPGQPIMPRSFKTEKQEEERLKMQ